MIVNTSNLRVARRSYFLNYDGDLERWLPPESIAAAGFKQLISTDIGGYRYKAVQRNASTKTNEACTRLIQNDGTRGNPIHVWRLSRVYYCLLVTFGARGRRESSPPHLGQL